LRTKCAFHTAGLVQDGNRGSTNEDVPGKSARVMEKYLSMGAGHRIQRKEVGSRVLKQLGPTLGTFWRTAREILEGVEVWLVVAAG